MKKHLRTQGLVLSCIFASTAAMAQVGSISETLAPQTENGAKKLSFSIRSFDKNDASAYGDLGFVYGFSDQFNVMLRVSGASEKNVGVIRTGGSDVELQLVFRKNNFYASVGASLPSTPSQDQVAATYTIGFAGEDHGSRIFLGLTGVAADEAALLGVAAGLRTPITEKLSFDASTILIARGNNTVDFNTGTLMKTDILSFALRFQATPEHAFWISASNALGSTTGFGMSHRLGNGLGFGAGIEVKF